METWPLLNKYREVNRTLGKTVKQLTRLIDDSFSGRIAGDEKIRVKAEHAYNVILEGEATLEELAETLLNIANHVAERELLVGVLLRDEDEFILTVNPKNGRIGIVRITPGGKEHGHEVYKLYSKASGYIYATKILLD
ncbi:MAG: hypothetical protein GSR74_04450 [Desulfurococcales archaeon]|nr:hypothetical protein [Desulfurococcales archaeon]